MKGHRHSREHLETMHDGLSLAQRLENARLLLKAQNYLRDSESDRIKKEIQRDWDQP